MEHDVMKILKIKPGPEVGRVLSQIFNEVDQGRVKNEREVLLKEIEKLKNHKIE